MKQFPLMDELMQKIYDKHYMRLEEDYNLIQKIINTTTVPYVKEFIQKYLEWENDRIKVGKLYKMFPEKSGCETTFFHLWLVLNNYIITHNEYEIRWFDRFDRFDRCTGDILSPDDWDAIPRVVPGSTYHPLETSAKDLLDAMEQWELNDKRYEEYHKDLHIKNQEWLNSTVDEVN